MIPLYITGFILWLWGINIPFAGIYNANNNYLMLAARNYLRFGFNTLHFFPTYFAGQHLSVPIPFYLHHPILIFPLSAVPFIMFGFHNWVVHVTNFLFLLGDVVLLYLIGTSVWNRKIGLWAAGIATIIPITSFFWKYIFFEQGALFFNLLVFYFAHHYVNTKRNIYLTAIFVCSILGGLIDWGILYISAPLIVYTIALRKNIYKPIIAYALGTALSIGLFIWSVYILQGGFKELTQAIAVHGYTPLLQTLPYWPIRLTGLSIVRMIVYFTPLSVLWLYWGLKTYSPVMLFFFVFGCMNLLFLPSVSWENSYFLFYFIPFIAYAGAQWFTAMSGKRFVTASVVLLIIAWSGAVHYLKIEQVKKQVWKYEIAGKINGMLMPYERVVVVNYPGDILENYYYHPTVPLKPEEFVRWRKKEIFPMVSRAIYSCDDGCNVAQLIYKEGNTLNNITAPMSNVSETSMVRFYRLLRDYLKVDQL